MARAKRSRIATLVVAAWCSSAAAQVPAQFGPPDVAPRGVLSTRPSAGRVLAAGAAAVRGAETILSARPAPLFPVAAAVQTRDAAAQPTATTISGAEAESLPASGRHWQQFLPDTPGSGAARESSGVQPDVQVDGLSIRLAFGAEALAEPGTQDSGAPGQYGAAAGSHAQSWSFSTGARAVSVSEAALRTVETEAGNVETADGRVNIETERGGDRLHGQGFFFDRQNNWGAQNPFTQWVKNTGSVTAPVYTPTSYTPPDHETVWGFGAGAPLRRDKLFWFAALDSYRRNDPGLAMVKYPAEFFFVPTPNDAQIQLLSAQLDESEAQAYNDYLGVAAAGYSPAGLEQLAGLLGPAPRRSEQWVGFARLDWQAAERHRFALEGTGANWNAPGGGLSRLSETYGSHSFGSSTAGQQWLLARWEAYLTPNLLATTEGSAGRDILTAAPDPPSPFEKTFLSGNAWGQLPQIVVDGRYGFTMGNPSRFGQGSYPDEKLYHAQERLDWVHNGLLVKAGFGADHNSDATTLLRNQTGTYYYAKVQSFISDALAFEKFGFAGALDLDNPHNCGVTASTFGTMPCYSYYEQTMGPTHWQLTCISHRRISDCVAGIWKRTWKGRHFMA